MICHLCLYFQSSGIKGHASSCPAVIIILRQGLTIQPKLGSNSRAENDFDLLILLLPCAQCWGSSHGYHAVYAVLETDPGFLSVGKLSSTWTIFPILFFFFFFSSPETGSHVFSLTWNALICLLLKSFGLSVWIENGSLDWDWWPWLDFNNFYFSLSLSLPLSHWENVLSGKSFERGFFGTLHV